MKNLTKTIAVAVVAVLCVSALSVFGADEIGNVAKQRRCSFCGAKADGERGEKPELTEEQKTARLEEMKTKLAEKLEKGEITQEQYDEMLAKIESGDFVPEMKGKRDFGGERGEKPELTEEQKTARLEEMKTKLTEKLAKGEITQEQYDEMLAKIESGDFAPEMKGKRDFGGERGEKPELTEKQNTARNEEMKTKLAEKLAKGNFATEKMGKGRGQQRGMGKGMHNRPEKNTAE